MTHSALLCKEATHIIANPQGTKRPFSKIVHHAHTCAVCDPKLVAASIAHTVFSARLLQKVQHA